MKKEQEALQPVVDMISEDGANLRVISSTADSVEIQLDIRDAECAECVMPRQFLEGLVISTLQNAAPWIRHVTIRDPREEQPNPAQAPGSD